MFISDPYRWEAHYTPDRSRWVDDLSIWFDKADWNECLRIPSVPFAMRSGSRNVSVYLNDCALFVKR